MDLFTIKILLRFLEFREQGNSSDNKVLSLGRKSMSSSTSYDARIRVMIGNSRGAS